MESSPELEIIAMIRDMVSSGEAGLIRGIGDDCAILAPSSSSLLVSTDTLVAGVHFDLAWHPPRDLGHKCAAVNLSDIAAMGACPRYAFLSLALPEADYRFCRAFMEGFVGCLEQYGACLVGGDTVRSPVMSFTVTVIGEASDGPPLRRDRARPGDLVVVSGLLGEAAAGLELFRKGIATDRFAGQKRAHLAPDPQVPLGRFLARTGLVRGAIDLSDGLASDLAHICRESGLGAEISGESLPVSPVLAEAAAAAGADWLDLAISGGEDYQLLFTVAPGDCDTLAGMAREEGFGLTTIGRMIEGEGVWLRYRGRRREITATGFTHFSGREG